VIKFVCVCVCVGCNWEWAFCLSPMYTFPLLNEMTRISLALLEKKNIIAEAVNADSLILILHSIHSSNTTQEIFLKLLIVHYRKI
jgi:hypothetical protein